MREDVAGLGNSVIADRGGYVQTKVVMAFSNIQNRRLESGGRRWWDLWWSTESHLERLKPRIPNIQRESPWRKAILLLLRPSSADQTQVHLCSERVHTTYPTTNQQNKRK